MPFGQQQRKAEGMLFGSADPEPHEAAPESKALGCPRAAELSWDSAGGTELESKALGPRCGGRDQAVFLPPAEAETP